MSARSVMFQFIFLSFEFVCFLVVFKLLYRNLQYAEFQPFPLACQQLILLGWAMVETVGSYI